MLPSSELLSNARQAADQWAQLSGHPGLVCPRDVFVAADADGSPSLVMAHPYHPGAVTIAQVGRGRGGGAGWLPDSITASATIHCSSLVCCVCAQWWRKKSGGGHLAKPSKLLRSCHHPPPQAHLMPTQTASGQLVRNSPTESLLWSYTVQVRPRGCYRCHLRQGRGG